MQEVIKVFVCSVKLENHANVLILGYATEHQDS